MKCEECGSEHTHQTSTELIEYCNKDMKVEKIYWKSEFQEWECQDCGWKSDTLKRKAKLLKQKLSEVK